MMRPRHRLLVGALLVGLGWLVTPAPVAVYDGVGVPDEPYRFVSAPPGRRPTAPPTDAKVTVSVANGVATSGLVLTTQEQTPQFQMYFPTGALAAKSGPITIHITPEAPSQPPPGSAIGGNVYLVAFSSPSGPVTTTAKIGIASLYLRAVEGSDGWVMWHRATATDPWVAVDTSRGGTDSFVSSFKGAGDYALAKPTAQPAKASRTSLLPYVLGGAAALLVLLVVAIRLRSAPE